MDVSKLPQDLVKELKRAGWSKDRNLTINENIHDAAKKFLTNWADISIVRTNIEGTDWFDFNWKRDTEAVYPIVTEIFSNKLGRPLVIVGECDCGSTTIMIDDFGRFFRDCDTILCLVALNEEQLFYNLWNSPHYDRTGLDQVPPIDRKL